MKTVDVTLWSDFVCPWCWIAKRRLETAIDALSGQVAVNVTTRSYRLAKGMAPIDFTRALHQKFGNPAAAGGMMAAVRDNGQAEGLVYNFDKMRFGDTSDAHALVMTLRSPRLAGLVIDRLYQAATTEGLDIFDRGVLIALAGDVGATDLAIDFDSPALAAAIAADEAQANRISNGVPLFVFNDAFYLSGAQPAAVFEKALLEAAVDVAPGAICGVDGCTP